MSQQIEHTVPVYKDWSNAGPELECLGNRLDHVRHLVKNAKKGSWAHTHWQNVEGYILRKWRNTLQMKDVGMRQLIKDPVDLQSYDWWEGPEEIAGLGFTWWNDLADLLGSGPDLEASWANAIEKKIQRARQGLA